MRSATITAVIIACTLCTSPAWGQVKRYEKRTTPPGDIISATAELELAQGIAERERAAASEIRVRAQRQLMENQYQFVENAFRRQELRQARIDGKREAKLRRAAEEAMALAEEAELLVAEVQQGTYAWPVALQRPEFLPAVIKVERILKRVGESGSGLDPADRRTLQTVAGDLRWMLVFGPDRGRIRFPDRVRAMETVKQLEFLAAPQAGATITMARK